MRDGEDSPGRFGRSATVEVDPRRVGEVDVTYRPRSDAQADPGEVVWTWVPYEENDGRGKDRPVLIVARAGGSLLGVALTSKPHEHGEFVAVGAGGWDGSGRPSWAGVGRVFRVQGAGVRRVSVAVDARVFARVSRDLVGRYGWGVRRSLVRRVVGALFGR
jgi:hypothetical protein